MTTPHIDAADGAFADTVLLPGDPLRAAYIAEHFLQDVERVTSLRNMLGYTGRFRDQRVDRALRSATIVAGRYLWRHRAPTSVG